MKRYWFVAVCVLKRKFEASEENGSKNKKPLFLAVAFCFLVLTSCNSQDVGLANAPCRMVGGCLATVRHQEIY